MLLQVIPSFYSLQFTVTCASNGASTVGSASTYYLLDTELRTFNDARVNCQAGGGDLAMLKTEQEYQDMLSIICKIIHNYQGFCFRRVLIF